MKRFLFVAASLLLALTAEAEVRGYGELTLDFKRAKKTGQSIVIPAENGQKQKLYVAVVCEGRVFNSTDDEMIWGEWRETNNIFESRIVADVCNLFEISEITLPQAGVLASQASRKRISVNTY